MTVLIAIAAVGLQLGALRFAIEAWEEAGAVFPNKGARNRYAFATFVLSVAALLTAHAA